MRLIFKFKENKILVTEINECSNSLRLKKIKRITNFKFIKIMGGYGNGKIDTMVHL